MPGKCTLTHISRHYIGPETVVCFLCLLHIFKHFRQKNSWKQTIWSLIRLLPWEQSVLGPNCLQYRLLENISRRAEQTTKVVTGGKRVKFTLLKSACRKFKTLWAVWSGHRLFLNYLVLETIELKVKMSAGILQLFTRHYFFVLKLSSAFYVPCILIIF